MAQFFETLRIEFGPDIHITLVTPGFLESELTQGKYIAKDGKLVLDQEMRDVSIYFHKCTFKLEKHCQLARNEMYTMYLKLGMKKILSWTLRRWKANVEVGSKVQPCLSFIIQG